MTYHSGGMGQLLTGNLTLQPSPLPSSGTAAATNWRTPIVAAADRFLVAVRAARRKMPDWSQGRFWDQVAVDWFIAARKDSIEQLRVRNAFFAPIVATSMPATRYGAQVQRDEVLSAQAALKSLLAPAAAVSYSLVRTTTPSTLSVAQKSATPYVGAESKVPPPPPPPPPPAPTVPSLPAPTKTEPSSEFPMAQPMAPMPVPEAPSVAPPMSPPLISIDTSAVAQWRKDMAELLAGIDSIGTPLRQAAEAAAASMSEEAASFAQALIDLVTKVLDPGVPDAQVAGKAQEVFTSYQQIKPSLPSAASSVLDPVIVGVATKIPSELALGPSATGPATMIPGQQPSGGIPWVWIGAGAVVLIGGYMLLGGSKKEVKANRRRRRR